MPGSHASVQKLKLMFDSGKDHNLLAMDAIDPNDIATLLKLYLRERKFVVSSLSPLLLLPEFSNSDSTPHVRPVVYFSFLFGLPLPLPFLTARIVLIRPLFFLAPFTSHSSNCFTYFLVPTPLLPAVFLEQFQTLLSTDRQICHNLRGILIGLPRPNYVVLSYLCHHLSRIAAHADKTKMNVSNLGVVFAPTLSIGSVLFKALLGGYYDTIDSSESREKGLKIVWGGLLQDVEYDVTAEWPEDSTHPSLQPPPLTPAQEIVHASTLAIPSSNTFPQFSQSAPADHSFTAPPTSIDMALSAEPATIDDEEAKLMAAMVLREELATMGHQQQDDETSSNASSSSGSIPCTDTTALSAVSSPGMNAKDQAFEASFTSPSMAFSPPTSSTSNLPSHLTSVATTEASSSQDIFSTVSTIPILLQDSTPNTVVSPLSPPLSLDCTSNSSSVAPIVHITIDAGSPLSAEFGSLLDPQQFMDAAGETTKEIVTEKSAEVVVGAPVTPPVDVLHKNGATGISGGVPQLPPLEGLMIAL